MYENFYVVNHFTVTYVVQLFVLCVIHLRKLEAIDGKGHDDFRFKVNKFLFGISGEPKSKLQMI